MGPEFGSELSWHPGTNVESNAVRDSGEEDVWRESGDRATTSAESGSHGYGRSRVDGEVGNNFGPRCNANDFQEKKMRELRSFPDHP